MLMSSPVITHTTLGNKISLYVPFGNLDSSVCTFDMSFIFRFWMQQYLELGMSKHNSHVFQWDREP